MSLGHLSFTHSLRNVPIPRLRWCWSGSTSSWLTAEIGEKYADAVVALTWELPSWLSARIDRMLTWVGR